MTGEKLEFRDENQELAAAVSAKMRLLFNDQRYENMTSPILQQVSKYARVHGGSSAEQFDFEVEATLAEERLAAIDILLADPDAPIDALNKYLHDTATSRSAALRESGNLAAARIYERVLERKFGAVTEVDEPLLIENEDALIRGLAEDLLVYLNHHKTYSTVRDVLLRMVSELEYMYPFDLDTGDMDPNYFAGLMPMRLAQQDGHNIRNERAKGELPLAMREEMRKAAQARVEELELAGKFGEAYYYRNGAIPEEDLHRTTW